jgi:hypothetical protein
MTQQAVVDPIYAGYTGQLDALRAAGDALALEIDDAGLRQGAQLLNLAVDQRGLVERLVRELLVGGTSTGGTLDTPGEITPVARDLTALEANEAELTRLTSVSDYSGAAAVLADGSSFSDFTSLVRDALAGGTIGIADLIDTVPDGTVYQRYAAFEAAAQTAFDTRADDIRYEAESRRLLWLGLAAAAGVCLAITLVVLVR